MLPNAFVTANYANSTTNDFDLESKYFGCVVNTAESLLSAPVACTIKATAYNENDYAVAAQDFDYKPAALTASVRHGRGFSHTKKVEFETVATVEEVVATLFDDVNTPSTGPAPSTSPITRR